MRCDTVIEGRALVDGKVRHCRIGISDGRIASLGPDAEGCRTVVLGESEILMPGFIDPHVHFRDPGATHKEDFSTGTTSAVCAGVTCVYDMPNTSPPVTDIRSLNEKKAVLKGRAYTDYGLFAAVTAGIDAPALASSVVGFKLFMGSTTGNILLNDDAELVPAVEAALDTGRRVSVHAEDDSMISREPEHSCADHARNRPPEAETNAISRLAARFRGSAINICHVSTPEGLLLAKDAGFSTEATLHHMTFDTEHHRGAEYKVNPPIRDPARRDSLRASFLAGEFDMIGTDHAPHTTEEKGRDFNAAPSGIPGVETTMPIVMEMVADGELSLEDVSGMASLNPGRLFDVSKGRIAVGYDADLSIFDLRRSSAIDVSRLHSRCGHTPYAGFRAVFPLKVFLRGSLQVSDCEFCGEPLGRDVRGLRDRLF